MMKNKHFFHIIISVLLFCSSMIQGQNYIFSGGEMGIFGPVSFGTSISWATARTANPGYYSWTIGSGNYTNADDGHHINGYVKKYGSEPFVFPVGSGTDLRTLSISAPSNPSDVYAVAWIVGDPTIIGDPTNGNLFHPVTLVSGEISAVSTAGQWDWQAVRGTGAGLTITVSIPQLFGTGFNDASLLRLVGWNGNAWESLGTAGASGTVENSTLSGIMKAGIQAIGIGCINSIPVDTDSDGDGLFDSAEGVTNDTDNDGIPNYLDPDDDDDGIPTKDENADPNGNGIPDDAIDSDKNGIPDYLQPNNGDPNLGNELEIFNGISPDNGNYEDGVFIIRNIEKYPDNVVTIYDRWGDQVYQTIGYNLHGNVFIGEASGGNKYGSGTKLKENTYFYVIKYRKSTADKYKEHSGYLYIKRE
ncbi:gliding motility-associated C-terminal domain-containing protein [Flavobacterium sp. WC2509]|uniref:gliding motility-associated C-terminal domain-containing protein n=1 Tax=Flavobacterium sp. WC2509 TaxID=3461406 RepID=UPI0040449BD6